MDGSVKRRDIGCGGLKNFEKSSISGYMHNSNFTCLKETTASFYNDEVWPRFQLSFYFYFYFSPRPRKKSISHEEKQ